MAATDSCKPEVLKQLHVVREELVMAHLATIPVERLRDATQGRLRLGSLQKAGYETIADVLSSSPGQLRQVPGVGEQTATQTYAAARHVASAAEEKLPVRLDAEIRPASHTRLLAALRAYDDADRLAAPLTEALRSVTAQALPLIDHASATTRRVRWLFTGGRRRAEATTALQALAQLLDRADTRTLEVRLRAAMAELAQPALDAVDLWADYEARAPDYYGILGELADISLDVAAIHGYIPTELAERISEQQLDTSHLRVSLRGYQRFGAKFALVQRRCIVGDEMGLGKTVEAIAVMCHLAALGATHFLVVCPASVLVNWTREVSARSHLRAHRIHGGERDGAFIAWRRHGGVGVTTYDTLRYFSPPNDINVAVVVVDEAHFVKNPATVRARSLRSWTATEDRVLFLTGTPMENRVDEFRNLVHYLQPDVAAAVRGISGVAGAASFRSVVAPVYLRRNQEDVLTELPERLDAEEWIELSRHDVGAYRQAVASGNFMAMRRAAFVAAGDSAKLRRLLEINDESRENGWKVVVFSYFHDVLEVVYRSLEGRVHGPLTGKVPPSARQRLVDEFSASPGHAVLLSQIQAGGTGMNLQAASVVVLTEPQWKPSMEEQAIARCHRMGQVRRVHVHRLLGQDSVDHRMREILSGKQALFDEYVRRSVLKDVSPDAVDVADTDASRSAVSAVKAEQLIVERERVRLGLQTAHER